MEVVQQYRSNNMILIMGKSYAMRLINDCDRRDTMRD